MTASDGVYSRYFIVPPGISISQLEISSRVIVNPYRAKFSVVVSQQDQLYQNGNSHNRLSLPCCGSSISPPNKQQQYKIVPFGERSSNSLSLRISDIPPIGYYPPARIGDLRVVELDYYNRGATLLWTAPGEDYDQGIVASYQIFYSMDSYNENWRLLTDFTADIEAGVQDNTTVKLPHYGSFLVAISAVDFYNKAGKISNIVRIPMHQPNKETGSGQGGIGNNNGFGVVNSTPPSTEELRNAGYSVYYYLYIIICVIVVILLLSAVIVLLLYCRKMDLSKRKGSNSKTTNDGKIAAITIAADPKSPIHWSASELLGEHEKRHSLYDGNVNLEDSTCTNSKKNVHHYTNHGLQNGGPITHSQHPMHLNIPSSQSQIYNNEDGSSPGRRTHSPDSYDDPDSPIAIPISVRNRHLSPQKEYYGDLNNCTNNIKFSNYSQQQAQSQFNDPLAAAQYYHHYQVPHNNTGYLQSHTNKPPNPSLILPLTHQPTASSISGASGSAGSTNSSTISASNHPQQSTKHYDPEIQGSMSSVNSSNKKRNITMV